MNAYNTWLSSSKTVDVEPEMYDKNTMTFSFEQSSTNVYGGEQTIILRNPKTNNTMKFTQYKKDYDSSHEDIYGWWFCDASMKYKLLIIND